MVAPLQLESLNSDPDHSATVFLPGNRLAQIKRDALNAGHDLGYRKARDELKAKSTESTSRLVQKLQEITFTHFEARNAVVKSLEPLIRQMVALVLPGIASEAISEVLMAQVQSAAARITEGPVCISCAPSKLATLQKAMESLPEMPVQIIAVAEPECSELELRISSPESERHIDLDKVLAEIRDGIDAFYAVSMEEQKHG